jgi:hypothetical protein
MQRIVWVLGCALFGAAVLCTGTPARADDKNKEMEAYMKAATPGPQHQLLATLAGSWTFTAKMWPAPGAPEMDGSGSVERKMIMGGRYLREEAEGTFGGMKMQGLGLNGYDNTQQKFIGSWVDSMGTGMSTSVGTADSTGKVITYKRTEFDPLTGTKAEGRDVLRIEGNDRQVLEFNRVLPGGKEFKIMEIVYTRKK